MKKLCIFLSLNIAFFCLKAQTITLNEETKKYEMKTEITSKSDNETANFSDVEEWLASTYTNKFSSSKYSNKEKKKIIYGASSETKFGGAAGVVNYNYTIAFEKNKIKILVSEFTYTQTGINNAAVALGGPNFNGRSAALEELSKKGKKNIIPEVETKINDAIKNLSSKLN